MKIPPSHSISTWRAQVEKELGAESFEDELVSTLPSGLRVEPLAPDQEETPDSAGFPGLGRQIRGSGLLGPEGGHRCAPLRDEPRAEDLNACLLEDLANGLPAAHIALDRGARLGHTTPQSHPGERGLVIGTATNISRALQGVQREAVALSFDIGANARPLLTLLRASESEGCRGPLDLGHDPIAALANDGVLPGSMNSAWDDAAQLVEESRTDPMLRPLALDARPWHEAGADMELELGLLLASGAEMLRAMEARGVNPQEVAQHVTLRVAVDPDVFPSIALLRAARLTWAQLLYNCGLKSLPGIRVHAFEGARALSKRDPWVNILRTTTQAFAAQIAGANVFTPLSYDRALGAPGMLGRRVARNTPTILDLEGHIGRVVDPVGGSGHVEALTDGLARGAWEILREVEAKGGLAAGLLVGDIQAKVQASSQERRRRILAGQPKLVGVSLFPPEETAVQSAPEALEALARDAGNDTSIDLAWLSKQLSRGESPECEALRPRRDAALFEEQGGDPLGSEKAEESAGSKVAQAEHEPDPAKPERLESLEKGEVAR